MDRDQDSRLPPLPTKSVFKIFGFLLLQIALVPLQRMFGIKSIEGWNCTTQIFVNYLRYSVENELHSAREAEQFISWFLNLGVKDYLIRLESEDFHGHYIDSDPTPDDAAILLYFHGGGYSLCTIETYLSGLLDIRKAFKTTFKRDLCIFGLDYTLSPEVKYPAQIDEAVAAYTYMRERYPNYPLIVMGDSAGGNLVLALLLKLKQSKIQQPDGAIVISPWVKMVSELEQAHRARDSDRDFVSSSQLVHHTHRYLSEPVTADSVKNPLVSPIFGDFSDTCPIFVHYGAYEWMVPEIEELIANLRAQNVDLNVVKERHAPHITPLGAQIFGDMGMRGVNAIAQYIARKSMN